MTRNRQRRRCAAIMSVAGAMLWALVASSGLAQPVGSSPLPLRFLDPGDSSMVGDRIAAAPSVPPNSIIVNQPDSFYYRHRALIALIALSLIGQTGVIIGLIWNIIHCRRSNRARQASEATLGSIFRAAPAGMGLTVDRVLHRVSDRMCEMVGYRREELIGQSTRMLYPTDEDYEFVGREKYRQIDQNGMGTVESRWRRRDGQIIDVLLSSSRIDAHDPMAGVTFTAIDITERKVAERALRESEQRFRELADHIEKVFWICDPDGRMLYVSPAIKKVLGLSPAEALGKTGLWRQTLHPDDAGRMNSALAALCRGKSMDIEFRIIQPDGSVKWLQDRGFPVVENEQVVRMAGLVSDITERKANEAQIANLARFPAEDPSPVLRVEADGRVLYANHPADRLLRGLDKDNGHTVPETWLEPITQSLSTGVGRHLDVDHDGRTFTLTLAPIVEGGHVNIYGMDITELRRAANRQRLITRELDHRVKNNLAAVQSLAEQTLHHADSMTQFREAFLGRLQAMARTHEALAQARWEGVDLREAALLVLSPYLEGGIDRFRLDGEHLQLPPRAALPIGLALHELATNAVKYGALSTPHGRVTLSWRQLDGQGIEIFWRESGGPAITRPPGQGTGTSLIRGLIGYELQGQIELTYPPDGATCKMVIPPDRFSHHTASADTLSNQPQNTEDTPS